MSFIFVLCYILSFSLAASPAGWRDRSIYQLLTDRFARTDGSTTAPCAGNFPGYCNGTWIGIENHLDYIQNMGFDAIWISPITQQVADPSRAYHGYSQTNLYGTNANFGTPGDLQSLSQALHSRGMYLMVDVVANHFGAPGPAESIDYTALQPLNAPDFFHEICWISDSDYATHDSNMIQCWIGNDQFPLPDVNTTQSQVRTVFHDWIGSLVRNYSVDGLRVDTVKNVEPDFWPGFEEAAGIYAVGEVADPSVSFVCPYQTTSTSGVLAYPMYYNLTDFFSTPSTISSNFIATAQGINTTCSDPSLLGSFSENHDQPRFASHTSDIALAQNVLTYTVLADGIPIIYAGQEQHYSGDVNNDREATWLSGYNQQGPLVPVVTTLNNVRRTAINAASAGAYSTSRSQFFYFDDHSIGVRKGPAGSQIIYVVSNVGSGAGQTQLDLGTAHGYSMGTELTEVLSCSLMTVGNSGDLRVTLEGGAPQVLFPTSRLAGSGICGE